MKKINLILCTIISTVALSSCSFLDSLFTNEQSNTSKAPDNVSISEKGEGYYVPGNYTTSLAQQNANLGMVNLDPIGERDILVVPVQFKLEKSWTSEMLKNIDSAFFGKSKDTYWESVSSYYYKSSYGKLNIRGEVTNPIKINMTTEDFNTKYGQNNDVYLSSLVQNNLSREKKLQYDKNNDGFIDAVSFIYSNDFDGNNFWAWVYWASNNPNKLSPTLNNHMWASYAFLEESGKNNIDAHIYIHETGHLLGLDDYYCYEQYNEGIDWNPVGGLEMQSYNVGDQSIVSKFFFGWAEPYIIDGKKSSVTLELKSSSESGNCIVIGDNWNGSAFDEYLIVEFYTPEGLNRHDALNTYENGMKMYTEPGVRIYHVDARLAKLQIKEDIYGNAELYFKSYTDEYIPYSGQLNSYISYIGASNSSELAYIDNYKQDFKLTQLMLSGGSNKLKANTRYKLSNKDLFHKGDTFKATSEFFPNGTKWNSFTEVGYEIQINDIVGDEKAIITVNKI